MKLNPRKQKVKLEIRSQKLEARSQRIKAINCRKQKVERRKQKKVIPRSYLDVRFPSMIGNQKIKCYIFTVHILINPISENCKIESKKKPRLMINIKLNRKTKQKIDFTKSSSEHI